MEATGRSDEVIARAAGTLVGMAEDSPELQHPVLQRLQSRVGVEAAVRRSAAWAAGSRVVSQFLQFVGLVISARLLIPSDYGNSAVIAPILAFGGLLANLGLSSAIIHARRVTEELLSTVFWINAVAGVVLTGIVAALAMPLSHLFRNPRLAPLLVLAGLIFTINLGIVHNALLERTLRFKTIALLETGCVLLSVITIVVTAARGAGPYSLVWGPLVNQGATTLCLWTTVRWRPRARPTWKTTQLLWTVSRGLTGYNILEFWSRNSDNLMLARFVSLAELGNYNRAYNLMKLPVAQMNAMMVRVMFPAMVRLRDDRPRLARAWLRALSTSAALVAPVTWGMAVTAPAMIEVLFGRRWLGMVTILQLLAAGALPQTLTTTAAGLLRAVGANRSLFRMGVATSVMTFAAVLIGLPWGARGVATALLIEFFAEVFVCLRPCLRELDLGWIELGRATRGMWVASAALAAAGLAVRIALPASVPAWQVLLSQVAASGVAYVGVLWMLDRGPVLLVWQLLRRRSILIVRRSASGARGG